MLGKEPRVTNVFSGRRQGGEYELRNSTPRGEILKSPNRESRALPFQNHRNNNAANKQKTATNTIHVGVLDNETPLTVEAVRGYAKWNRLDRSL